MRKALIAVAILLSVFTGVAKANGVNPADLGYKKIDINKDAGLIEPGSTIWIFYNEIGSAEQDDNGNFVFRSATDTQKMESSWAKIKVATINYLEGKDDSGKPVRGIMIIAERSMVEDHSGTQSMTIDVTNPDVKEIGITLVSDVSILQNIDILMKYDEIWVK